MPSEINDEPETKYTEEQLKFWAFLEECGRRAKAGEWQVGAVNGRHFGNNSPDKE